MVADPPLGLTRCASCGNAFSYDRAPDGTCRHCGGRFDRGPGRPEVGPTVHLRLTPDLLARLDTWADRHGLSRAAAIRELLTAALDHTTQEETMAITDTQIESLRGEAGTAGDEEARAECARVIADAKTAES